MPQLSLGFEYAVCIDSLIGEKPKAMGIKCPCPIHSPEGVEGTNAEKPKIVALEPEPEPPVPPAPRRIPFDAIRDGEENKQD
jgi:hypothetical protein